MIGKKAWRLKKTLGRHVEARPIEQADVKYAYAGYKNGVLSTMGFASGLDAPSFKSAFENYVLTQAHAAWTILAETKNGFIPVGFAFGGWAPGEAFIVIIGIVWFPWASKRNIIEGTVAFFTSIRSIKWMGFATHEHKRPYEVCCIHGIMRRVGTSNMSDQPAAVYEGRR